MKTVLAIGGSDSSGCSGVQADLKVFSALGLHGATTLTSVTAQNTQLVARAAPLEASLVQAQLASTFDDLRVCGVKVGLTGSATTLRTIGETLRPLKDSPVPIVVDPVIHSSTGKRLLSPDAQEALLQQLVPLATLITPNAHEAEALTGISVKTPEDAVEAGRVLIARGCGAVLVKGGHFESRRGTDVLILPEQVLTFPAELVPALHTRGTGCSLASAITAFLVRGLSLSAAVPAAKEFVRRAIEGGYSVGEGPGPIDSMHAQRCAHSPTRPVGRFHALTDQLLQTQHTHVEIAKMALEGGAEVIQYREVARIKAAVEIERAAQIAALCEDYGATFIVNDRADIARAAGAAGVHLGKEDLPPTLARALLGPNALIGHTANTLADALLADAAPVDYIGIGPVFGTTSKANAPEALGIERFHHIASQVSKPVIAIGGIEVCHVNEVIDAGAFGIAVLSGLWPDASGESQIERYADALKVAVAKKDVYP
ncbi:MAG: bifunctional hydroxymethylpyrimidine kinase/phosphomethylpyrimidine kinase [Myxococcota bacterium]|nr:bifunctional hydroxymethylpyrimidine kinase/phosphomethylpyrimidine kinase [Myxococcota bacterium]